MTILTKFGNMRFIHSYCNGTEILSGPYGLKGYEKLLIISKYEVVSLLVAHVTYLSRNYTWICKCSSHNEYI